MPGGNNDGIRDVGSTKMVRGIDKMTKLYGRYRHAFNLTAIATVLFFLYVFVYINNIKVAVDSEQYSPIFNSGISVALELKQGDVITQTFESEGNMHGIGIQFGTYQQTNQGEAVVTLAEVSTGTVIAEEKIDISTLADNQGRMVIFNEPVYNESAESYELTLEINELAEGSRIAVWTSETDAYAKGSFSLNSESAAKDLLTILVEKNAGFLLKDFMIAAVFIAIFSFAVYCMVFIRKAKPENIYVVVALFFGIFYTFLLPPMTAPDEGGHLETAYMYSNSMLGLEDADLYSDTISMRVEDANHHFNSKPGLDVYRYIDETLFSKTDKEDLVEINANIVPTQSYLYLCSSLGLTLARILHWGTVATFFLGRIFNLLFFVGLTWWSIKKIPFGRLTLFIIGIFPMVLQQASSFSYDAIINALAYAVTAQILFMAYGNKPLNKWDYIRLAVLCGFLAPCKGGAYIPVCLLIFLIPKERLGIGKKSIGIKMLIAIAFIAFSLISNYLITSKAPVDTSSSVTGGTIIAWAGREAYTISYFLHDPLALVRIIVNTVFVKLDFYFSSVIGGLLGCLEVPIADFVVIGFAFLLFLSTLIVRGDKVHFNLGNKFYIWILCLASIGMCEAAMLINWTPVGYFTIEGVQGRYFLPVILIAALTMSGKNIVLNKSVDNKIITAGVIFQLIAVYNIACFVI